MGYDTYAARQIKKQRALFTFKRLRELDFAPFDAELRAFKPRAGRVAKLVTGKPVVRLRALIDAGALTSVDLTLHYLRRIAAKAELNAVLELNPDALTLARAADKSRKPRGLLHGIPVLIKDNIATGDAMHTSAGAAGPRDARADRDAFLVTRLRQAGAVILGKSNLSEWANFFADEPPPNGFSAVGGQTRNPHGLFDVGGSSAGSGSAVAAGLCACAVGTETHGSIVYPSLCNGVFGLKPSLGLISRDRIVPITDATDTAGPMARSTGDLALLLNALAGIDLRDAACAELAGSAQARALADADFTRFLTPDGLRGKRVGVLVDDEKAAAILKSYRVMRARFARAGATLVNVLAPPLRLPVTGILGYGFVHGVASYFNETKAPVRSIAEVVSFNAQDLAARAPNGMGRMQHALRNTWSNERYVETVLQSRAKARRYIDRLMRKHALDLLVSFDPSGHEAAFVMAGAPLLAVPAGTLPSGRPYGFTLAGRWLDDGALIAAAHAYIAART